MVLWAARTGQKPLLPLTSCRDSRQGRMDGENKNLSGSFNPLPFQMYGNPGDYAWGRGGLDVIVTQLLNQMDGTGPPPLKGETIEKIPKVKVTQEHVGKLVVS